MIVLLIFPIWFSGIHQLKHLKAINVTYKLMHKEVDKVFF